MRGRAFSVVCGLLLSFVVADPVVARAAPREAPAAAPVAAPSAPLAKPAPRVAPPPAPQPGPAPILPTSGHRRQPQPGQTGEAPVVLRPHGAYVPLPGRPTTDARARLSPSARVPAPEPKPTPAVRRHAADLRTDEATVPGPPTGATAIPRDEAAVVSWIAPVDNGGSPVIRYTVTASPGGATAISDGTTTMAEVFGLDNGTAYTFTVVATNAVGTGPESAPSAAVTPRLATAPGPVTGVQAVAGNARATISWQMPASDGGADIIYTLVELCRVATGAFTFVEIPAPHTSVIVTQLVDGEEYFAIVRVTNRSYWDGPPVETPRFTPRAGPQPAPPASVTGQPGNGQATVSWTPPTDDGGSPVTGYTVSTYRVQDNALVGSPLAVGAGVTTATVTGLTNGVRYYFGVSASNAAGAGPEWYSAPVTPAAPPGAPTGLTAYPQNRSLFLTWQAPASSGGSAITSYTATLSGPTGTSSKTVTGVYANFAGLENGVGYTFRVLATNAVASGPLSAPSAPATPTDLARRPTGLPKRTPQPPSPPDTIYVEERWAPLMSGNGRFVFYQGITAAFTLTGRYLEEVQRGWYRYDLVTGATVPVFGYPTYSPIFLGGIDETDRTSASYDGGVFAAHDSDGDNLYVWRADTGQVRLASRNSSGGPTRGVAGRPALSADGRYLVFTVHDDGDMPDHTTCPPHGQFGFPSRPDSGDLYRYDTVTNTLAHIPLSLTAPNATISCVMPQVRDAQVVSADGRRIVQRVVFTATPTGQTFGIKMTNQLMTIDVTGNGSATGSWLAPLQGNNSWANVAGLSADGRTAVASLSTFDNGVYRQVFTKLNPDAPNAPPVALANADRLTVMGMSPDARTASVIISSGFNDAARQAAIVDLSSGRLTIASQVNGELAEPARQFDSKLWPGMDATGRRVALAVNAPNMLGRTDCDTALDPVNRPGCPYDIVVVDFATGAIGILPNQALGCTCRGSLGVATPLQTFAAGSVNTATGSYTAQVVDAAVLGSGLTVEFRRTYNSARAGVSGPLGPGWTHPYAMALTVGGSGNVTLTAEDGAVSGFVRQTDGTFRGAPGVRSVLRAESGGYTLTTPDGQVDTFAADGRLTALRDRNGRGLDIGYSGVQPTSLTDDGGRQATLGYDAETGRLTRVTMPDGRNTSYGYDAAGRLATVTDAGDHTTSYGYDPADRLVTVTDPNGHEQVHNTYDPASGRVTGQTQAGGAQPRLSWDPANEVATTTDVSGRVTIDYYAGNVLVNHVDGAGGTTSYGYDDQLNVTEVTDPNGNTTRMTYDAAGNMLTRTAPYPLSYVESWTYDDRHNVLTYVDGRGGTTTHAYDGNRLASTTDPIGGRTAYTYTGAGQLATVTDAAGKTTTNGYDGTGNLTSKTDPTGARSVLGYDAAGRVVSTVDPRGNTTTYGYDPAGRLGTVTDPLNRAITNTYDAAGNLVSVRDPAGNVITNGYDPLHRRVSVTDALGHTTTTGYDPQGEVVSATDPAGATTRWGYDNAGRVLTVATPRGHTTRFGYDPNGNNLTVTDALGHVTGNAYDALDRLVRTTDPLGNTTQITYDANGNELTTVDPTGVVTTRTYDGDDRLTSTTDPVGFVATASYDPVGRLLRQVSPLGEATSYTYDGVGRVLSRTDPRGFATVSTYDPAGGLLTVTDPLGNRTSFGYDQAGQLASRTDPLGKVTTFAYDQAGRPIGVTDPKAHTTTTSYDAAGNALSTVDPLNNRTTYTYDAADRRLSTTPPRGNASTNPAAYTTRYGYDADGNRTTVAGPTGAVTTTAYDAVQRPTMVTDGLVHTTTTAYDAAGRIRTVTDALGNTITNTYDPVGRLASTTDQLGQVTTFARDANGRLLGRTSPLGAITSWTRDADGRLASVTDPRGHVQGADPAAYTTTYGYDPAGNRIRVTDPLGHATTSAFNANNDRTAVTDANNRTVGYAYDKNRRLTTVTDPTGAVTTYTYDAAGNQTTRKNANGHTTTYGYDAGDRLVSVKDPLGRIVRYTYNRDGDIATVRNARGQTVTTSYDVRNLVTKTTYSDGTPATSYTYDKANRQVSATDATGKHTLTYDVANRLTKVSQPGSGSFVYTYDKAGHVTGRTYPDGNAATYAYDADGRQISRTGAGAVTGYSYDAAGNLRDTTYPDASEARGYDNAGRLASVSLRRGGATIGTWQVARDPAGQPTAVATTHRGATFTTAYTYDQAGRLTSACPAIGAGGLCTSDVAGLPGVAYTYDKVGNRLTQAASASGEPASTTTYGYDTADELLTAVGPAGTTTYAYDLDGNQTTVTPPTGDPVTRTFDAANRISSQTLPGGPVTYGYDAFGNRGSATQGTAVTSFAWDINHSLPALATRTDAAGTVDYRYDPLERVSAVGGTYLLHDWQDSVTDLADGPASADYDAFGSSSTAVADLGSGLTGYNGQSLNPDGATYNLRARQYDPATGRFLSRDPLPQAVTAPYSSSYAYAANAPTYLTDPSGLAPAPIAPSTPGNGWWGPGGQGQHDFVVEMAYEQEVALHGVDNVYADILGGRGVLGGARLTVPAYWSAIAMPDLVAYGVDTPRGKGFAVWDVKPASAYGRSFSASVNKLAGYVTGVGRATGWPVVAGDPVVPETRPYAGLDARGLMLMFNGPDWGRFRMPEPAANGWYPAEDIAPIGDTRGLIFYRLLRFGRKQTQAARATAMATLALQGARTPGIQLCQPTGVTIHATAPLRFVGTHGSAGAAASQLIREIELAPRLEGQLAVVTADPFPLPPPPPPLSPHVEPRFDGLGLDMRSFLLQAGGTLLLVAAVALLPEVFVPAALATEGTAMTGPMVLSRLMFGLAA